MTGRVRVIHTGTHVETTTGAGSFPGHCTANVSEFGAEISCASDATVSTQTVRRSNGTTQSDCEFELPSGSYTDSQTTDGVVPENSVSILDETPGTGPSQVYSGSVTEVSEDGSQRTWSWSLTRQGQYELILEPEGDFENWRPKAGPDEATSGNTVVVKATLRRKDGQALDTSARRIAFRLSERSFEPGVSMNEPAGADQGPPPRADLRFDPDLNAPWDLVVGGEDGSEATTAPGSYAVTFVQVSSYDWGAYEFLSAEAELPSGERVVAKVGSSTGPLELLIPHRRSAQDPIAAVWRTRGDARGGDALSDDDGTPLGDGHSGDGLTLYEEYRGFRVNGVRVEGDPRTKELFVLNKLGASAAPGIAMFARESGIRVHAQLSPEELPPDRRINGNTSGRFQRTQQHAVVVERGPPNTSAANADGGPATPRGVRSILVPDKLFVVSRDRPGYADATLAHEVAHCANVAHHGTGDPGNVTYRQVNGVVYEGPENDHTMSIAGRAAVTLLHEDGTPYDVSRVDPASSVSVAGWQGEHSGAEACFMRYDTAKFVIRRGAPANRYRSRTAEKFGSSMCADPAGTGVNSTAWVPVPRFGNAHNGDCLRQVCIHDGLYHPLR